MERRTRQRQAIRSVFLEVQRPLSPREVLALAQKRVPGLGLATVYRTLKGLLEEGFLVQVDLPGQPPRYERAGRAHHHHFLCQVCGQVFELAGCPQDVEKLVPPGFTVQGHEITLYGRCAACA